MKKVYWLPEPPKHTEKSELFRTVAEVAGGGRAVSPVAVSPRGFDTSRARAQAALDRAKRAGGLTKRLFLQGRYNWSRRFFAANPGAVALCWQGQTGTRWAFMQGARDAGAATLYAELAPLPDRITLDPKGVNAAGAVPQDPTFYDGPTDTALLADLASRFVARTARSANIAQDPGTPKGQYLFVPLQVPDDSQMVLFADWVQDMPGFITAIAAASRHLPDGWHLRVKEHPSAKQPLTPLIDGAIAQGARIIRDNRTDSFAQLRGSAGVVTANSSMGLQAMFFDKPVIVTGQSLYGIPGIATQAPSADALAAAFAQKPAFDPALRGRFLTWLATRYYISRGSNGFDRDHIARRLAGEF